MPTNDANGKHTPGELNFYPKLSGSENHRGFNLDGDQYVIAIVMPVDSDGIQGEANARRLRACWNFCIAKETELLEAAADFNNASGTAGWEEPHPIFMMAQERDQLATQNQRLREALVEAADSLDAGKEGYEVHAKIEEVLARDALEAGSVATGAK